MRQFPPPSSSSQGIAEEWDEFLRGFRLIRSHHFTPTAKWLLTGYWQEDVKQQIYSSGVFVLCGRGVYTSPQRHDSLLWAVAGSHGGGQGTDTYWHPPHCPLHTQGEGNAGSFLLNSSAPVEALSVSFSFKCSKWFPKSELVHVSVKFSRRCSLQKYEVVP